MNGSQICTYITSQSPEVGAVRQEWKTAEGMAQMERDSTRIVMEVGSRHELTGDSSNGKRQEPEGGDFPERSSGFGMRRAIER